MLAAWLHVATSVKLRRVYLDVQEGFTESTFIPVERMSYNHPEETFVLLDIEPNSLELGSIIPTLRFTIKEIDPSTGDSPRKALFLG